MSAGSVLCIVGPTASGKSDLAERVALELDGQIVSIDAMQVYRGMDIGTAKTPLSERRVALHMVDVADVSEPYSVACFQTQARSVIQRLLDAHVTPVLCGGTGLYLDAVIDCMSFPHGEQTSPTRSTYDHMAAQEGADAVYAMLAQRDPRSAELIHPHNTRRVIRALEMLDEGVSYAAHHEGLKRREPYYDATIWGIDIDRNTLYQRIDQRVDAMFEQGLVAEVEALAEVGIRESVTASQAIGYKELLCALDGHIGLDEARMRIKRNTRRYAKRQLSWIRRDGRVRWIPYDGHNPEHTVSIICDEWRSHF